MIDDRRIPSEPILEPPRRPAVDDYQRACLTRAKTDRIDASVCPTSSSGCPFSPGLHQLLKCSLSSSLGDASSNVSLSSYTFLRGGGA
jgi:hypothetical protein